MSEMHCYFKLFNSIKSEHEAEDFARLEIESLFGKVEPINNFIDCFAKKPLSEVSGAAFEGKNGQIKLQDVFTYELPYGKIHGYYGRKTGIEDLAPLIKRLGYTREIIVITKIADSEQTLKKIFPRHTINANAQFTEFKGWTIFRFITNQYFLEKSEYISKLSRNEREIEDNVGLLYDYLTSNLYRIPASATMKIGKRLEDYFAIREELSLYLTHYMHPYKGKFHPKMVRAMLNYILPSNHGPVLDNFAGSGTLLLEAAFLGMDSYGVEINPLSVLMSNVKYESLGLDLKQLLHEINKYLSLVKNAVPQFIAVQEGQQILAKGIDFSKIEQLKVNIPSYIQNGFKNGNGTIDKILIARQIAEKIKDRAIREFILLGLSGSISDAARRMQADFFEILEGRLRYLYLKLYLFQKLNEILKIELGKAKCYVGDARDMKMIASNSIKGIVNSPPYSTALDYIKNDEPQLRILELLDSIEELEEQMIGNPRKNYNAKELLDRADSKDHEFQQIPEFARKIIAELINGGRVDAALRCFKFFIDMRKSLEEMYRVLMPKAKCCIIIGNNHFLVHGQYVEIKNDDVLLEMGKKIGFKLDKVIKRELEKSSAGNIRYESVLILEKLVIHLYRYN